MAGVYVYDYDDIDIDTTGLVGDLQPLECIFDETKNGESLLTMRLCYDPLDKWKAVKVGSYIKALVPVRVPPRLVNETYTKTITKYRVKSAVTRYATVWQSCGEVRESVIEHKRPEKFSLFYMVANEVEEQTTMKEVKVKYRLNAGAEVQLLEERGERCKIYSRSFGTGWTLKSNIEVVKEQVITGTFNGVEVVEDATRLQYQLFQVTAVEQTLDSVSVTAQHVFYELLHNYTTYKSNASTRACDAINGVFDGMPVPDERFTCLTDTQDKVGKLDFERVSVVQALLDPEYGICARYGLSLIRDNYDLYALKNVGSDRGFVVEYGKNMLSVERIEDISNVVTRIIPYGKNKKGNIVYMDGTKWVDSKHINEYAMPRLMYLDCSDVATESKTMTLAQVKSTLKAMAQAEFETGCDLPELSMTVDFIALGDTEEYKQYRDLDKVYLYDRVTVKDKVRGYNYNAEVVAIRHNVLTGLLESITLGSIQKGTGKRKIATWQVPEVDGGNIRLESIAPGVLGEGSVGESNLQDDSVTGRAIVAYSVTAEKIAAGAITADKLAADAISADFIAAGSITADKMATGTITAESGIIAEGAIGTAQIADGSITAAKVVSLDADVIKTGTLSADRLVITGEDGLIYEINAQSSGLTLQQLTDEVYQNRLNGTVIVAESITAAQIASEAITANKILAGAVTADKIAANAVTADKIAAGAVTTNKISADFGAMLDLTGNAGIGRTYYQYARPESGNKGDTWVRCTEDATEWETLKAENWSAVKGRAWGELCYPAKPSTYMYDGTEWVLIVDGEEVAKHTTEIELTKQQIELKANKDDPATGLETTSVIINAGGVRVKTGGTFTVDSGNFDLDGNGNMSAQNAYLSGQVFVNGNPALSTYDIVVSTNPPEEAHEGMVWIKPDASTSARTTYSQRVPWGERKSLSATTRTGTLKGTATDPVGERYTYRIKVPIYLREYATQETGGVLHFDVALVSGGTPVLAMERNVTVSAYGTGNRVVEFEVTSDTWLGNASALYYSVYATRLTGYYLPNLLNSSDTSAKVSVECIARSSSGAAGWRECQVYQYA